MIHGSPGVRSAENRSKESQEATCGSTQFYGWFHSFSSSLFCFGEYPECETPIAGEFRGRLKSPGQLNHNMVPKSNRNSLKKYLIILIIPFIVIFSQSPINLEFSRKCSDNKNTVGLSPFVFWIYLPIFVNLSLLNSTTTIQNLQSESPQISI